MWGYLVETSEPVPRQSPDPLSELKQVMVAVSRGEGDVGFRAVIELPTSQNSICFSVLNAGDTARASLNAKERLIPKRCRGVVPDASTWHKTMLIVTTDSQ